MRVRCYISSIYLILSRVLVFFSFYLSLCCALCCRCMHVSLSVFRHCHCVGLMLLFMLSNWFYDIYKRTKGLGDNTVRTSIFYLW